MLAELALFLFVLVFIVIPIAHIIDHAGFSKWWALVVLWPGVNIVMLWVFALKRWPAVDPPKPGR
jgi:hypothetical protein